MLAKKLSSRKIEPIIVILNGDIPVAELLIQNNLSIAYRLFFVTKIHILGSIEAETSVIIPVGRRFIMINLLITYSCRIK